MKRVLIMGANGYIGSHLVKYMCDLEERFQVIASGRKNDHIDQRALYIPYDICNPLQEEMSLNQYFENPDICIYLAWQDGFDHNSENHMKNIYYHWNILKRLIDGGVKHIVVAGSFREYGNFNGEAEETYTCNPDNFYALAKDTLRKMICIYLEKKQGVCFQWIRPFSVIGDEELNNSIFSKITKWDKEGKESFACTTGEEQYDYIDIWEVALQITNIISQTEINGIINCCTGIPMSLKDMIETYIEQNHLSIRPEYGKYQRRKYDSDIIYGSRKKYDKIIANMK